MKKLIRVDSGFDPSSMDGKSVWEFIDYIKTFGHLEGARVDAIVEGYDMAFDITYERLETDEEEQRREANERDKAERKRKYDEICAASYEYQMKIRS